MCRCGILLVKLTIRCSWASLPFFHPLLDLLEGCPKVGICYDSVELAEIVTETTRNWGRTRNRDEWCRHLRGTKIVGALDCPREDVDLHGPLYRSSGDSLPSGRSLNQTRKEGAELWGDKVHRHGMSVRLPIQFSGVVMLAQRNCKVNSAAS